MKKQIVIILLFLALTVGCKPTVGREMLNSPKLLEEEKQLSVSSYYPFTQNTVFEYAGFGNEYAEQIIYFEFIKDNRAQIKIMNPGTNMVKVVENKDGVLNEVFLEGEFYHIENMLNTKGENNNVLLKEPLEIGNSWSTPEGYKREITGLDIEVETPYKTYKALEVTTSFGDGRVQKNYYAKNIGFIGSIYKDGDYEVKTLLKAVKSQPLTMDIIAYYPLYSDIKTVYVNRKINFSTNESMEKLLEDILKNPSNNKLLPVIPPKTVINSIHLDRGSWTLKVDFSKELLTDMNAGSSMENEMLKSIINTLGKFYDTDMVYITVEGRPYESGHIELREGENFQVDVEGIQEFK